MFLVKFDTCDVMFNWSISLLPPILLDNLFGLTISNSPIAPLLIIWKNNQHMFNRKHKQNIKTVIIVLMSSLEPHSLMATILQIWFLKRKKA